jgi:F-type H+-transporting ATPase subunit epsilon
VAKQISINLVSADREIWSGSADMIVAKTSVGEIGLLAGHEPILAVLVAGQIRISSPEGNVVVSTQEGGFLSMESDVVTVVVQDAQLVS